MPDLDRKTTIDLSSAAARALFSFRANEVRSASAAALREFIREDFRDPTLWDKLLPNLLEPGQCGSRAFDQANVVRDLLEHDQKKCGGRIAQYVEQSRMTQRMLWNQIYHVIQRHYKTSGGRIVDVREDRDDEEGGQSA